MELRCDKSYFLGTTMGQIICCWGCCATNHILVEATVACAAYIACGHLAMSVSTEGLLCYAMPCHAMLFYAIGGLTDFNQCTKQIGSAFVISIPGSCSHQCLFLCTASVMWDELWPKAKPRRKLCSNAVWRQSRRSDRSAIIMVLKGAFSVEAPRHRTKNKRTRAV